MGGASSPAGMGPSIALSVQQQHQPWTRVYLYTGANDSAPHKPIGDLVGRANFLMPERGSPAATPPAGQSPDDSSGERPAQQQQQSSPPAQPLARLVIEDPRLSDEALYKCDVTYVKGKCPSISLVRVQVMTLPSKAQIVSAASGPLAEGQLVGPHSEHEQLKLACLVYGGRPAPKSVIWRKIDASGRTINLQASTMRHQQQQQFAAGQGSLIELSLNHTLTSADLGAKFECHVEHEAIEEPTARVVVSEGAGGNRFPGSSDALLDLHPARAPEQARTALEQASRSKSLDSHVYVDLNVGVASLDLIMAKVNRRNSSEPLREGDLVELECVAYNSKPPANITWFNGSDSIEQLDPSTTAIQQQQQPGSEGSSSSSASGSVANNWHQQHRLRHKRLLQRNQVHQNNDGLTYNTHSFLSIKLSRHEHRAQILCKAQNGAMRQPAVKSLELQVEHAPIVLMEPAAGITVNEASNAAHSGTVSAEHQQSPGQTNPEQGTGHVMIAPTGPQAPAQVSIYCIYSANPSQLIANSTRWFKDGQLLHLQSPGAVQQETGDANDEPPAHLTESATPTGYPVLTIHQVSRRDAGSYECQLTNSVGTSERLPASEACRLEVNFRPSVQLRLFRPLAAPGGTAAAAQPGHHPGDNLAELDPSQELVLAGSSLVLSCEVLEAQPSKILRFGWFKRPLKQAGTVAIGREWQPMASTESGQFVLQSLATNFTPHSFACAASNSLGSSNHSDPIEIQLSYTPGPSFVRPVNDPTLRKTILASGRPSRTSSVIDVADSDPQPLPAGRELLLECVTPDLGQPRANLWLWFKNGHPIESSPGPLSHRFLQQQQQHSGGNNPSSSTMETEFASGDSISNRDDNPITDQQQELSAANRAPSTASNRRRFNGLEPHEDAAASREIQRLPMDHSTNVRLISSGRYLFIPSIQLVHKGNYSCVAVNRLGSSQKLQPHLANERDAYKISVALAPSFVQPLASRTYWSETPVASDPTSPPVSDRRLELVCQVQCEPICQIEWLRNNEPLDLKRHAESLSSDYVTYQVKQSILDENLQANLFKSIESKLVIQFLDNPIGHRRSSESSQQQQQREKILERRALLSGSNYTCQSSPNAMGPPVRSTTKFIVQYPPENVLINAPSDKLSLVEGSNGPSLSCEASGEPQVQYRWFLLKSSGSEQATRGVAKTGSSISQSSEAAARGLAEQEGGSIDQVANKAFAASSVGGVNDAPGTEQNLIELTSSATEQGGGAFSTLDLSNLSLDRKQTGRYICEASNKLGQSRQSVYVNVLYKPTCATLHLHSLDLVSMASIDSLRKGFVGQEPHQIRYKPYLATTNDEYSLARETNEDFIDLRKVLVQSPSFAKHDSSSVIKDARISQLKDTNALIHMEDKSDFKTSLIPGGADNNDRYLNHIDGPQLNSTGDSWDKFNILLLKFLNNYTRQVRTSAELESAARVKESKISRQNRRSSSGDQDGVDHSEVMEEPASNEDEVEAKASRNLLTFACVAQDANPASDLTFDWSFGSTRLPETSDSSLASQFNNLDTVKQEDKGFSKPMLVYANHNYTLQVVLVRRVDSKSSSNPFQMSLVTLDIVAESSKVPKYSMSNRVTRQTVGALNKTYGQGSNGSPVVRHRYQQSLYNNLKASQSSVSNVRFAQDLDLKPYNSEPSFELNARNWEEQIGNLLKCKITNQIGTSDVCHVRINVKERLKSRSSSEYAKWRMPSLANKSLLVISIMIGCTLIIFVTIALLLGPYLKDLQFKKDERMRRGDDNNTGQSTSSQKSSVLGLLGNGDSSMQGSSDDDCSAKMNQVDNKGRSSNRMLDMDEMSISKAVSNGYSRSIQVPQESSTSYDEPRSLQDPRSHYSAGQFNESDRDEISGELNSSFRYDRNLNNSSLTSAGHAHTTNSKTLHESTGSRLLANLRLKSLSKFKADRISDLSSFAGRLDQVRSMHNKNNSSSETNTTGLSVSALDCDKMTSPSSLESPTFFVPPLSQMVVRSGNSNQQHQQIYSLETTHMSDQSGAHSSLDSQTMHLSSQRLANDNSSSILPAYSNMIDHKLGSNALDDFIRQREVDPTLEQGQIAAFYRSQSNRSQTAEQALYLLKNDLSQYYPQQISRGPPVYPRQQSTTIYRSRVGDSRPTVAARSSHRQIVAANAASQPYTHINSRFSMPPYHHQPIGINEIPLPSLGYMDTIDSHLNRLTGNLVDGRYLNHDTANSNTYSTNPYSQDVYSNVTQNHAVEHIYDVNAYATPEQTPLRRSVGASQHQSSSNERPCVSQLIQTFNSKAPE